MRRALSLTGLAVIASACAGRLVPDYQAVMSLERAPDAPSGGTFAIANPTGRLSENTKVSEQTVKLVREGLERRGMQAASPDKADVIVNIDVNVGPPTQIRELGEIPITGYTSSPGYAGTANMGNDRNGRPILVPVMNAGRSASFPIGTAYYCGVTTVYDKQLTISARPNRARNDVEERGWDVSVAVRDNVKNPDRYVSMLARAAVQYAGSGNTTDTSIKLVNAGRTVKAGKKKPESTAVAAPGNRRYESDPCGDPRYAPRAPIRVTEQTCMYSQPLMLFSAYYATWYPRYFPSYLPIDGFLQNQRLPCPRSAFGR